MTLRELSLFSGVGGGLLGSLLLGWTPIGYVEYDDYCQRVIRQRIADGILPNAPIFGDVKVFLSEGFAASYQGLVDVVTAGWPCQPHSTAGKRKGADDEREGWPYVIETIRQVEPRWFLGENVPGILSTDAGRYFAGILRDLAESGYDCRWRILSAAEVGAPHKRDRLWIVAYTESGARQSQQGQRQDLRNELAEHGAQGNPANVADANQNQRQLYKPVIEGQVWFRDDVDRGGSPVGDVAYSTRQQDRRLQQREISSHAGAGSQGAVGDSTGARLSNGRNETMGGSAQGDSFMQSQRPTWWEVEPPLGRVVDGYAGRVDELRAIGNAQVASVVAAAWHLLTEGL